MFQDIILKQKEKYLEKLILQYEAACQQLFKDLNEANKVSIKAQIKDLENEIEEVYDEIDKLRSNLDKARESNSAIHKEYYQILENNLHKINFLQANQIVQAILGQ